MSKHLLSQEISERPAGYAGPNLSPTGLRLIPHPIGEGVVALMANVPPKDNNGVIFGDRAALVIDAGITPTIGTQIRSLATDLADAPLRYLVNTTYHGDHTFGNTAFDDLTVITSRANRDNMHDLGYEKDIRSRNMYGDEELFGEVTRWRLPDLTFEATMEIDLGGRTVELHHFGPGNGPGDTIVYVPSQRTAWTGNFLTGAGSAHMLLQGGPEPYIGSLRAMQQALPDLETIVPGHGPMGRGRRAITVLIDYLERLRDEVSAAFEAGRTLDETYELCTDPWATDLDPEFATALSEYEIPFDLAEQGFLELCRNLHRLNILTTYRVCEQLAR
ncbi:MBL fold metallo-hydrolase [Nocardia sp. CA-135398]|uniref:MBL fold metallo-hydrolase n=1 Tax=Nocardia sp. CA-135398 TaxID=3239977 RepID=UPI003D9601C1